MTARIHQLCTGSVIVKEAVRRGASAPFRRTTIFTDQRWSPPLPISCWLIEHDEGPILVDTGELATALDMPFVRFEVTRDDEVDAHLGRLGVAPTDLRHVILTHGHGDHIDGLARLPRAPASTSEAELRAVYGPVARFNRRVLRTPLPPGFDPSPLRLRQDAFGAFAESLPLTADGSVVVVPTPGHTPGHISVVVVIDGRHHFLAGDATYDKDQLLAGHVDGLAPRAGVARETMRRILRHAELHPTVYLPSHDVTAHDRLLGADILRPA